MKARMTLVRSKSDSISKAQSDNRKTDSADALRRAEEEMQEVRILLERAKAIRQEISHERFKNNFAEMMARAYKRRRVD